MKIRLLGKKRSDLTFEEIDQVTGLHKEYHGTKLYAEVLDAIEDKLEGHTVMTLSVSDELPVSSTVADMKVGEIYLVFYDVSSIGRDGKTRPKVAYIAPAKAG